MCVRSHSVAKCIVNVHCQIVHHYDDELRISDIRLHRCHAKRVLLTSIVRLLQPSSLSSFFERITLVLGMVVGQSNG